MEFVLRRKPALARLAVFPGAFNPPTLAHQAMTLAALSHADEVVLALSTCMPHKSMEPAEVARRLEWMRLLAEDDDRISVAVFSSGLFVEMARDARRSSGIGEISIVCGRDAAERAFHWDYGDGPPFADQLNEFTLLVAPRSGHIDVPSPLVERIILLDLDRQLQSLSSTEARQRLVDGAAIEELVPGRIARLLHQTREPLA